MNTIVLYYSFTGYTRRAAQELAEQLGADLVELKETKPRSKPGAFIFGSLAAIRQKESDLQPVCIDWDNYGHVALLSPIWAGNPTPAFNAIVSRLPAGKQVTLVFTSGGGSSQATRKSVIAQIQARGSEVVEYKDITTV